MTIPYGVTAVALFCLPPQATGIAQALYIFVTYNLCTTVVYTALNLPYATMAPLMTRDENDLAKINLFRMSMSPIGNLIVSAVTLPLINRMGGDQAAWIKVMSVWAVLALVLLLLCFFKCEEKVQIEARKKDEKLPVPTMLKALFTNQYFWAVMLLWTVQSVSFTITGTILPYYCKYIFNNDTWMYSALYLTETLVLVAGIFVCSPLIKKFGKRNIAFVGGFIALGGQLLFFLNPYSFGFMVMSCVTRAIGLAPLNAVVFSMVGDVVEFGQWKNHIRQESLIFAGGSIGTKVGAGLASAVITGLLSSSGYVSSSAGMTAQPETALEMIVSLYKFGPILIAAVIIVTLFGYKLDKMYPSIMQELTEREAHGQL
jgi:GPH family glycoside/pentoside/hexuronide:cation symporter